MTRPMLLRAYLGLTRALPWLLTRPARRAHARLGCDPQRLPERFGAGSLPRPDGKVIWMHAASVGELISALDLAADLQERTQAAILFTTMTQSAAQLAARRLPAGMAHQFVPTDTPAAVARFLDHWRPDLACFIESDLWPRLILQAHARAIPLALLNARPSSSRKKAPKTMGYLMSKFAKATAQDEQTQNQLLALGMPADRVLTTGDMKAAAAPLPFDPAELQALRAKIGDRPVWLAASTHPGEEEIILKAHRAALTNLPDLLLILIPRHPERAPQLSALLSQQGFAQSVRSHDQAIGAQTQVYLADTLGETGLFFRATRLAFMGASFSDQGGHNPFEPAQLGAAVLHGPKVRNFAKDYAQMDSLGAAQQVLNAEELAQTVPELIGSDKLAQMCAAGQTLMSHKAQIRPAILAHLRDVLP
ncbi:3-deoxy-D-manno-octulosonic acid transferase [Thalassobius sp. S69A]|uniref:3-deoxy-D-manno-octulosonic acid transferase n=1 Tax=unclassified Thalassovita TaxID=2619711 RepID=UPI000C11183B|nr:3-deoxy-D-manno-octulosonic acid transferase [Paracoccaceae bacterium]MBT25960.1 3-deoxy-D-manno-octulosonic acid transferase [Paracoccaceae bacterium]